jgi:hypothetical protein
MVLESICLLQFLFIHHIANAEVLTMNEDSNQANQELRLQIILLLLIILMINKHGHIIFTVHKQRSSSRGK